MSYFPQEINQAKEDTQLDSENSSNIITLINNLDENSTIEQLKEINAQCVDLIFEEKPIKSLEYLKKLESFLETAVIETNIIIPKKIIIIVLYNIACCFQKLKDLDNCILYLDALIYHFDKNLEKKYNISITLDYFDSLIKSKNIFSEKKDLGDWVLDLRFSAKFHIQMSVILSQAKRHVDSLYHAKLAGLICEDNIIKAYYLYLIIQNDFKNNNIKENGSINELNKIKEQIKLNFKIIFELKKMVLNLRNNSSYSNNININNNINNGTNIKEKKKKKINTVYHNYFTYVKSMIKKTTNVSPEKTINERQEIKKRNLYDSYDIYRKNQIESYQKEKNILTEIKNIFEKKFTQKDDWLNKLNIENIIYLSALNYDDLDFDSDSKYELLRDSLLEKVIMLTVSYYCISNELKFLSKDKNNKKTNGEYYHYNALYFALIFLPPTCPIVNYFVDTYYKNYKQGLEIIPEGKVNNYKIDLTKKEVFSKKNNNTEDCIYFTKIIKLNKIIKEKNVSIINDIKSKNKSNTKIKGIVIHNSEFYNKKKKNKIISNSLNNSINSSLRQYDLVNISDSNIFPIKKLNDYSMSKFSNSQTSLNTSIDLDNKNIKLINGNFGLIPNNNFIKRVKKSKIKDIKAPKFNLNLDKINFVHNRTNLERNISKVHKINHIYEKEKFKNERKKINKFELNNKHKTRRDIIDIKINLNSAEKRKNRISKSNSKSNNKSKKASKINKGDKKGVLKTINVSKKIINKRDPKDLNNIHKKRVSYNKTNKPVNIDTKKIIKINKIANLVKYFSINNSINIDREYLTERTNIKEIKKFIKGREIIYKSKFN